MSCVNITQDSITSDNIIETSPSNRFSKTDISCGSGAFKTVWVAIDNQAVSEPDKIVVWSDIKIPKKRINKFRLLNEVNVMNKINSINGVNSNKIYNLIGILGNWYDKSADKLVMITEYAGKGSLGYLIETNRLSKRPISNSDISKILFQVLKALQFLHTLNLIHRDIKPDNMVITNNDIVKIIDFGLATKPLEDSVKLTRQRSVTTDFNPGEFSTAGTPEYMAPEIWSGREFASYNEKVDIYSVGWVLYSMLSLEFPFIGMVPEQITTIAGMTIYQSITYRNYREHDTGIILDRELSKIAYCQEVNKTCISSSNIPSNAIPDMEYINTLFINDRETNPFPNQDLNYLDFLKDCILEPDNRLSAEELLEKYFIYPVIRTDPFSADYKGNYMSFGG